MQLGQMSAGADRASDVRAAFVRRPGFAVGSYLHLRRAGRALANGNTASWQLGLLMDQKNQAARRVMSRRISNRTVIALHSSASGAVQWKRWESLLPAGLSWVTPNLLGYAADEPQWSSASSVTLASEAKSLAVLLQTSDEMVDLVGHSYGGAVAIELALRFPDKVASLILYEPVRFSILRKGREHEWNEIFEVARWVKQMTMAGCLESAGMRFVDYWSGKGTWNSMSQNRRNSIANAMPKVKAEFDALFSDSTPLSAYSALRQDVLLLTGSRSPAPAKAVVDVLSRTLPKVRVNTLQGLGHMGPIEAPEVVAAACGLRLEGPGGGF